jgi:cellulose synthase/poly-beta-1,6-N-acetylglucosamine synthase-like glycosyltransferase
MIFKIIFWISVFSVFHTYVLYPVLLNLLAKGKKNNLNFYKNPDEFPFVSLLLSVYNEEKILPEKLKSLQNLEYPDNKLEILIASDASNDNTDKIIEKFIHGKPQFKFMRFSERTGKIGIINQLSELSKGDIFAITDANIMHDPGSLTKMIRHFKEPDIGLVDSFMYNTGLDKAGISLQESAYVARETKIKNREGRIWGTMMGPSGGFYTLRKESFSPVPVNFLVDDFYICMKVLESGKKAINEPESIVFEDVSNNLREEFRRKVRISAGNFQNINYFSHLLIKIFHPLGFCFFSHKFLRWLGPFFILAAFFSNLLLIRDSFYTATFILQLIFLLIPFIDLILRKIKIHIVILRFITHFLSMNLAIFAGFIQYMKGIKSNVWKPTRRNQS